jgi:hypothetical protein
VQEKAHEDQANPLSRQPSGQKRSGSCRGRTSDRRPASARGARGVAANNLLFFVGFNFVVFTTNLLVAEYAVAVSNFMLATVAALVVGKAVLVANAIPS